MVGIGIIKLVKIDAKALRAYSKMIKFKTVIFKKC